MFMSIYERYVDSRYKYFLIITDNHEENNVFVLLHTRPGLSSVVPAQGLAPLEHSSCQQYCQLWNQ